MSAGNLVLAVPDVHKTSSENAARVIRSIEFPALEQPEIAPLGIFEITGAGLFFRLSVPENTNSESKCSDFSD
jgi:hypothetical protein